MALFFSLPLVFQSAMKGARLLTQDQLFCHLPNNSPNALELFSKVRAAAAPWRQHYRPQRLQQKKEVVVEKLARLFGTVRTRRQAQDTLKSSASSHASYMRAFAVRQPVQPRRRQKTHARRIGEGSFLATTRWDKGGWSVAAVRCVSGGVFQNKHAMCFVYV